MAVFRDDQAALRAALTGWTFEAVVSGVRVSWPPDVWLELPVHEVHGQAGPGTDSRIEFLLNERDGADWVYRRDQTVRRPMARALGRSSAGVRFLAPEIVLLYKAKAPRPRDEHDFRVARAVLDDGARAWLRAALAHRSPAHPWMAALAPEV